MAYADGLERNNPQFLAGWKAYQAGTRIGDNPCEFGSTEYEAWEQGWNDAMSYELQEEQKHG